MKSKSLNTLVASYKKQLQIGDIQVAYSKLVKYVTSLKTHCANTLGHRFEFGNIFQGYMDYTYFYFTNEHFKGMKLKLGLVLNHSDMRFELWLLGQTKDIQKKYWHLLRHTTWIKTDEIPKYSIFEHILIEQPNFDDLSTLTIQIEKALLQTSDRIASTLRSIAKGNNA